MESKIFIDIDVHGNPQIRIFYNSDGDGSDVRDKILHRFIADVMYGEKKEKEIILEFGHTDHQGTVAFIRLKESERKLECEKELPTHPD